MNSTLNGHPRKSLAEQLDRFDTMLDGLADGLNDAVATAATAGMRDVVCLAVQQAVRTALTEVLRNPELQRRLAPQPAPTSGLWAFVRAGWSKMVGVAKAVWQAVVGHAGPATAAAVEVSRDLATATRQTIRNAGQHVAKAARRGLMAARLVAAVAHQYRVQLLGALAVGTVVGIVCWVGGREIASIGCGLGGFAGSLASGAVERVRRFVRGAESLA